MRRLIGRVLVAGAIGTAALVGSAGTTSAAPPPNLGSAVIKGYAWGAEANLTGPGGVTKGLGRIAYQTLPCDAAPGATTENHVAGVDLSVPPLLLGPNVSIAKTGTIVNTGTMDFDATFADAIERSTVQNVDLLAGVVTADALTASSHTTLDAAGVDKHSSIDDDSRPADGTTDVVFTNLKVLGVLALDQTPAPNTVIALPGIGSLTLNEQINLFPRYTTAQGLQYSGVIVNAVHLRITNVAGFSGDVIIGQARTKIVPTTSSVRGYAFAASTQAPPLSVGRQSAVYLPCGGTGGTDKTLVGVGLHVPGLIDTGETVGTVNGTVLGTPESHSQEQIANVDVLDGTITADAVTVQSATNGGAPGGPTSTSAVHFVNLNILGTPVPPDPAPNTVIPLLGIGEVILHRVVCDADVGLPGQSHSCTGTASSDIVAQAIFIRVTVPGNVLGLPVGAIGVVGAARSGVTVAPPSAGRGMTIRF